MKILTLEIFRLHSIDSLRLAKIVLRTGNRGHLGNFIKCKIYADLAFMLIKLLINPKFHAHTFNNTQVMRHFITAYKYLGKYTLIQHSITFIT